METMDYNKFDGKKSGVGFIIFMLIIILGGVAVTYALINEPQPIILGQDSMINVYIEDVEKESSVNIDTSYKIKNIYKKETVGNFKADIVLPSIKISNVELKEINAQIYQKFIDRYNLLKEQNSKTLENTFTYKITYNKYYNKLEDGTTILSFKIYEKIIDNDNLTETMNNIYGYNIDVLKRENMKQFDIAAKIIGADYSNVIRTTIKNHVINKKMIKSEDYIYSITGLEEYYIKDKEIHIVFNTGDLVGSKYKNLDIKIIK